MSPRLSIVVPIYLVEQWIERCLNSIGAQRGLIECILVDDCSPDGSMELARKFFNDYVGDVDFRIIHHEKNRGLAAARNTGIESARGEYIMFVDSDDYLSDKQLQRLLELMDANNLDCLCYRFNLIVPEGVCRTDNSLRLPPPGVVISNIDYLKNYDIVISSCGHIARLESYRGLRFSEGELHEDYSFMLRMYERTRRMMFVEDVIYNYDIKSDGSISTVHTLEQCLRYNMSWLRELILLHDWAKGLAERDSEFAVVANRALSGFHYAALTCLIKWPIPRHTAFELYAQYRAMGVTKLTPSNISYKRRIRQAIYAIPLLYKLLLRLKSV